MPGVPIVTECKRKRKRERERTVPLKHNYQVQNEKGRMFPQFTNFEENSIQRSKFTEGISDLNDISSLLAINYHRRLFGAIHEFEACSIMTNIQKHKEKLDDRSKIRQMGKRKRWLLLISTGKEFLSYRNSSSRGKER